MTQGPPRVAALTAPDTSFFELGLISGVFGSYLEDPSMPRYALALCSEAGRPARLAEGATLATDYGLEDLVQAHTVIVPSRRALDDGLSPELLDALREAHRRGARMVSTCNGAFVLAAAGLLDDRPATTHWRYVELMRVRYPKVRLDPNPLYVDDGDVLTSAGSAAGLDLCLHLVRRDFGAGAANALARRLVVQPHREGGQAQYIETPVTPCPGSRDDQNQPVAESMAWALQHLSEPLTVAVLARRAQMSERSYLRHFASTTGSSPIRWLISQRVRASLPLLESTCAPVEEVAAAVGFDSVVTFRHHFGRLMHTSPSSYRRGFST